MGEVYFPRRRCQKSRYSQVITSEIAVVRVPSATEFCSDSPRTSKHVKYGIEEHDVLIAS